MDKKKSDLDSKKIKELTNKFIKDTDETSQEANKLIEVIKKGNGTLTRVLSECLKSNPKEDKTKWHPHT